MMASRLCCVPAVDVGLPPPCPAPVRAGLELGGLWSKNPAEMYYAASLDMEEHTVDVPSLVIFHLMIDIIVSHKLASWLKPFNKLSCCVPALELYNNLLWLKC